MVNGTALLLKQPFGPALVIIVGLLVLGVACYLFYTAYAAKFQAQLNVATLPAQVKKLIIAVGRAGYAAVCSRHERAVDQRREGIIRAE